MFKDCDNSTLSLWLVPPSAAPAHDPSISLQVCKKWKKRDKNHGTVAHDIETHGVKNPNQKSRTGHNLRNKNTKQVI